MKPQRICVVRNPAAQQISPLREPILHPPQRCIVLGSGIWRRMEAKLDFACAVVIVLFVAWLAWEIASAMGVRG
ncbi:MAG: hypothetical protein ACYCPO_06570 [Acidobacteriaceae bacterium]